MFLEIVKAKYLDNYRIRLTFNNGITKIVDLADKLTGAVFAPLKNVDYFKKFNIKYNTIEWENGADYAPEYLYEIGT
ncbi:MAG: DUF2442 domain-containing protein [Bacteroidales bacterium]|jgi:hypothetical protein|nr:DUF2442 domain-containing protein [Bacteroidales bacterium]